MMFHIMNHTPKRRVKNSQLGHWWRRVIQKLSNPIKPEVVTETQLHLQNEIGIERNPLLQVTSQSFKKGSEKDSMLRIVVLILNRCLIIEYKYIYIYSEYSVVGGW